MTGRATSAGAPPRTSRRGIGIVAAALVAAVALRVTAPQSIGDSIGLTLGDAITFAISVVIESLPFVFLGIAISVAVQLWIPAAKVLRRLPRNPIVRRAVLSLVGVVLPVCECGNVPLTRGFIIKGVSVADATTFLLAAPILNPVTILTTYQAFGWDDGILVARVLGGFAIANGVGWIIDRHPDQQRLLTGGFQETCRVESSVAMQRTSKATRSLELFAHETASMLPALFVGAALAGLIQGLNSRDALIGLASDPVWSVLALMLLAFVVAICSNVDAFFALALGSAFLPGSVVAFLVFGPMIDVKMLALLRTTFTTRTLLLLTGLVAFPTLILGLGMNLIG